jgi:site-specific recombinase XerD
MLDDLFRWKSVRARVRANPMREDLERYLVYLRGRGHVTKVCREYVGAVAHFGWWLKRRPLSQKAIQQFMRRHLPSCRCLTPVIRSFNTNSAALNHLLEMKGIARIGFELPSGFVGDLLRRYAERLTTVRGLAATTVHTRVVYMQDMLTELRVRRAGQFLMWTPEQIERYICGKARRISPSTGYAIACAARSFLRFLLQEGLIDRDLSMAVPKVVHWRLASLPETLAENEIAQLIDAVDVRTPMGLRDRAMLLCMSELGLRVSDVAGLELEGIDITARVLWLRCHKKRQAMVLPMTGKLAGAMEAYLRRGRPVCPSRRVFVVHQAPRGKPITRTGIRGVVTRLAALVGLGHRVGGTHVFRHSVASRMLGAGANIKQIADLLGHQSIDTTAIYAKVDLNALSAVALPWPGTKEVQR